MKMMTPSAGTGEGEDHKRRDSGNKGFPASGHHTPPGWLVNGIGAVPSRRRARGAIDRIVMVVSSRSSSRRWTESANIRITPHECLLYFHLVGMMPWEREQVHC